MSKELIDLIKAWIAISLAFTIAMRGLFIEGISTSLVSAAVTVGLGFIVHETAHKLVANKYGYKAEFRSSDMMLLFSLVMSFFGFVFIAPGAVVILGFPSKEENAKISSAGIAANLVLAGLFALMYVVTPTELPSYGVYINSWLAFFNLLPFGMFDGKKIFRWNKLVYFSMGLISLLFLMGAYLL